MDLEMLKNEFKQFQEEYPDFDVFFIIDGEGNLLYSTDPSFLSQEDAQLLIMAWLDHESAVVVGENRYPILSWEIFQFAARNVRGKGALVGTETQSKCYVLGHIIHNAPLAPAIGAIYLNRKFWKLI